MSLTHYNRDLFPKTFSTMLDNFFNESVNNKIIMDFQPKVDIKENENFFEVHVALPGMKKEEIKISLNEKQLTISGERRFEKKEEKENFHLVETQYGSFSRSFYLPEHVDKEKIEAEYKDGMLNLLIPKIEKANSNKQIQVK